jgi:cytoskeletal protein CcmA (bactofilin family)
MLRRRELKGNDEVATEPVGTQAPVAETPAAAQAAPELQATAPAPDAGPGGLAWRPMRAQAPGEEPRTQRASAPGDESVIGPDDFFSGNYRSHRGVRVQGRVEGSIESSGHVLIEEQAQVTADMTAENITVAGRYNGKVECRHRFEITPSGIVTGEINTDLLVVQEGGYFDGKLKMKERSGTGRAPAAQQSLQRVAAQAGGPDEEQKPAQV